MSQTILQITKTCNEVIREELRQARIKGDHGSANSLFTTIKIDLDHFIPRAGFQLSAFEVSTFDHCVKLEVTKLLKMILQGKGMGIGTCRVVAVMAFPTFELPSKSDTVLIITSQRSSIRSTKQVKKLGAKSRVGRDEEYNFWGQCNSPLLNDVVFRKVETGGVPPAYTSKPIKIDEKARNFLPSLSTWDSKH